MILRLPEIAARNSGIVTVEIPVKYALLLPAGLVRSKEHLYIKVPSNFTRIRIEKNPVRLRKTVRHVRALCGAFSTDTLWFFSGYRFFGGSVGACASIVDR
jgi:hypothetical protein